MGEVREAIIRDGKILCPYCHKVNGELTGKRKSIISGFAAVGPGEDGTFFHAECEQRKRGKI